MDFNVDVTIDMILCFVFSIETYLHYWRLAVGKDNHNSAPLCFSLLRALLVFRLIFSSFLL